MAGTNLETAAIDLATQSLQGFGAYSLALIILAVAIVGMGWLFKLERKAHEITRKDLDSVYEKLTVAQDKRIVDTKESGKDLMEVTQLLVPIIEIIKSTNSELKLLKDEVIRGAR